MKLIFIIPAYNEEKTIGRVLGQIPGHIRGIEKIETLVIDDGSTDATAEKALTAGADGIVTNRQNIGLARSFQRGINAALERSADIIVNLDADGQYDPQEAAALIEPILAKRAEIVIGDRQIAKLKFMPAGNKYGNLIGSWALRKLTGARVRDASSGFRAFSREAALNLYTFFSHTYTHETIIQAVYKNLPIAEVPIRFRERQAGESRLINSLYSHIKNSTLTIVRTILMYKPLKTLFYSGLVIMVPGIYLGLRFLYYFYVLGRSGGKVQSLILAAILIIIGFFVIVLGLLGDLIAKNRKINEDILYRLKKNDYR